MKSRRALAVAGVVCACIASWASVGSAGKTVLKQRIAIVERASVDTGGEFELIPLARGPLKHDSGGVSLSAVVKAPVVRTGLSVTPVIVVTTAKSNQGSFRLKQTIESVDVGDGYSSDRGTWVISGGTGLYEGVKGSGRFAGVSLPGGSGIVNIRQEGYVTK